MILLLLLLLIRLLFDSTAVADSIADCCLVQMARKRPRIVTDFEKIGEEPSTHQWQMCTVSCVLSPLKKGRNLEFFDGDGKRRKQCDWIAVELKDDCQLKRAKRAIKYGFSQEDQDTTVFVNVKTSVYM